MRERVSQAGYGEERHHAYESMHSLKSKRRLDLNVLLKRAKDQEKSDKKFNLLIYIGAIFVIAAFILILSL